MDLSEHLSFLDISLAPATWNSIKSRKDVSTSVDMAGETLQVPLLASNMTSVYSPKLAHELARMGGRAVVPRFYDVETNIRLFKEGIYGTIKPWVSCGLGEVEYERAITLEEAGAGVIIIDVANAACDDAAEQFVKLRRNTDFHIIVGNFAAFAQYQTFMDKVRGCMPPDAVKLGVGQSRVCQTRMVTGVGYPALSTLLDFKGKGVKVICDGGMSNSGDLAKALACGADVMMSGSLFAATQESNAEVHYEWDDEMKKLKKFKKHYGSASNTAYKEQGKMSYFRTAEGIESLLPISGTVEQLVNNLMGGLRSAMTYTNSLNLNQLKEVKFSRISNASYLEGLPRP